MEKLGDRYACAPVSSASVEEATCEPGMWCGWHGLGPLNTHHSSMGPSVTSIGACTLKCLSPLEGGPRGPIHQGSSQAGRASYQCPEGVPRTCRPAEVLTIPTPQSRSLQSSTPRPSGPGVQVSRGDRRTPVGSGQALGKNGEATQRDQCPRCALVPPGAAGPSPQLSRSRGPHICGWGWPGGIWPRG